MIAPSQIILRILQNQLRLPKIVLDMIPAWKISAKTDLGAKQR